MSRRLQNRIASSRLSLPVMLLYAMAAWTGLLLDDPSLWPSLVLFCIATYLIIELNNRNALMRQYSRMMSCSYIAMMTMCPWLLADVRVMAFQVCVIAAFSLIFMSYQRRDDMGHCFWAYLFIGLASFLWPPVLILVPVFWVGVASCLMSFSLRAFFASIIGIVTPVWIALPIVFYSGEYDTAAAILDGLMPGDALLQAVCSPSLLLSLPLDVSPLRLASTLLVAVMMLIGIAHFFRQSYNDKIHVRMLYQFFTLVAVVMLVVLCAILFLPFAAHPAADCVLSALIVCASPFIAHYVTFTSSRLSNTVTILGLIIILTLTALGSLPRDIIPLPSLLSS
ncbi:MAG: hypothetical protein ACI3Y5_04345 [Prevotella sp.]